MKRLIHHIRNQPDHIREIATVVCTVVVVAIVVAVWFRSFKNNIYALLNPDQNPQAQDQLFTQESKSLFGSILQTLSDGKAQISSLFSGKSQIKVINSTAPSNATYLLPVSGNR